MSAISGRQHFVNSRTCVILGLLFHGKKLLKLGCL